MTTTIPGPNREPADKRSSAGCTDDRGFPPRTRLLILLGASAGSWALLLGAIDAMRRVIA